MRKITRLIIAAAVLGTASAGQAAFKNIGWGVRPAGMGNAFVAVSNDANSVTVNPAGIALVQKQELAFDYSKPYMGLENVSLGMMYAAYVRPSGKIGSFGAAITNFDGNSLYKESTYQIGYAKGIYSGNSVRISGGLNVKYMTHGYIWDERTKSAALALNDPVVLAGDSKGAPSADIGFIAALPKHWSFGLAARNLNQPDVGLYYEDKVPMEVQAGAAYKIPYFKGMDTIIAALDVSYRNQEWGQSADKTNLHFGVEGWFGIHTFGLRAGADKNDVTMGASYNRRFTKNFSLQIDYALVWSLAVTDNVGTHRLGASVKF